MIPLKLQKMAETLKLNAVAGHEKDCEITGCYIGDLMSLAMANLEEGNIWITIQTNLNVVAVSVLKEAGCVILADGAQPDADTKAKAEAEEVSLFTSEKPAYILAKELGALGI